MKQRRGGRAPAAQGAAAAGARGKSEREVRGFHPPAHPEQRWSEEAGPRRRAAAGFGVCGGGAVDVGRGRVVVSEVPGVEEILSLPSPWAEKQRGGVATVAGGGEWRRLWWRHCRAREGASGGG